MIAFSPPAINVTVQDPDHNPSDAVSCLAWHPDPSTKLLACSSWDSTVRVYDLATDTGTALPSLKLSSCIPTDEPCLSVCWDNTANRLFAASIDTTIKAYDVSTKQSVDVGRHDGVKDVHYMPAARMLCSVGFDKMLRFWDQRQQNAVAELNLGFKVFCSDMLFPRLVLGLSSEKIRVINLLDMQRIMKSDKNDCFVSPLGEGVQLASIALSSHENRLMTGSIDGRTNISAINPAHDTGKMNHILTFKSHITDQNMPQRTTFPVHSVGFHPKVRDFLYTAGADGRLIFWDERSRNKIVQFDQQAPVTRAKLSGDASVMAYSLGYDWSNGIEGDQSIKSSVHAHIMQEQELIYRR